MAELRLVTAPRRRFAAARRDRHRAVVLYAAALGIVLGMLPAATRAQVPPTAPAPAPSPIASPAASGTATCTDANLLRAALVTGFSTEGIARRAQDGQLATEGTVWNAPAAVQLKGSQGQLRVDLRTPMAMQYLLVQGDDNDNYIVEGSEDGRVYTTIWTAPPATTGQGLRSRWVALP